MWNADMGMFNYSRLAESKTEGYRGGYVIDIKRLLFLFCAATVALTGTDVLSTTKWRAYRIMIDGLGTLSAVSPGDIDSNTLGNIYRWIITPTSIVRRIVTSVIRRMLLLRIPPSHACKIELEVYNNYENKYLLGKY